jgi:phosphonate transport system substrate-binding protein
VNFKISTFVVTISSLLFLLSGCEEKQKTSGPAYAKAPVVSEGKVYTFAVHPLHNPQKLSEAYQPIVDYLNSKLTNATLELEASKDYGAYEQKIASRNPDFLLPNPWQTLQAIKVGYDVIAMAGDKVDFKGIILVRKDSNITTPLDLKGKTVSYPSKTALAACIMPQFFLYENGLNINKDINNIYVGSQESSIMNVYIGKSAAGATWPLPWRLFEHEHPKEAANLKVIWETPSLVNNSVMVRNDIPQDVKDEVQYALLMLATTNEGRGILKKSSTSGFYNANNETYNIVADYMKIFEANVRVVN